jgi:hypothetical protein
MNTPVEVRLPGDSAWIPAQLTDERSFGHTVVLLDGESHPRSPIEVYTVRPVIGTDVLLLEDARRAGYVIVHTDAVGEEPVPQKR